MTTITDNEFWAAVDEAIGSVAAEEQPPGSFTSWQYARRNGVSKELADGRLNRMVNKRLLNAKTIRLMDSAGRVRETRVYWVAKG